VLAYPRIQLRWGMRPNEIEQYLETLATVSEVVAPVAGTPVVLNDVEDDPVVYSAVAGRADVLCTIDSHFYEKSVREFCKKQHIEIMGDVELLRRVRSQPT